MSLGEMEEVEFSTISELEEIPFVKRWMENKDFRRLSLSRNRKGRSLLMVDMMDDSCWAIGWISREFDDLPKWVRRPFPKKESKQSAKRPSLIDFIKSFWTITDDKGK